VTPLVKELVEILEEKLSLVEVEIDEGDCAELAMRYQINSIPTLMAFRRSFRQKGDLKGDQLSRQKIQTWLQSVAENSRSDRL